MKRKRLEKTETSERSKIHPKSAITEDIRGRVGTNDTNVANQISSQVDRPHVDDRNVYTRESVPGGGIINALFSWNNV